MSDTIRVSGRKLEFDLASKDWVTKPITLIVHRPQGHFDAGGMRVCFFVQEVEDDGCTMDCVAKFFKTDIPDVVYADYLNEAMAQCLSEEFAQNYNKLDTPKKISFLTCNVVVVDKRDVPPMRDVPRSHFFSFRTQDTEEVAFCMEPRLNGEFTKYNSNFGDCYANNKRDAKHRPTVLDSVFLSAEAFSHFTLKESGGSMLVCDLQGVEDLLTDPQIHTEEGKGLGMGNMGEEGIEKWAVSHKCNEICHRLGLPPAMDIIQQNQAPPPPPVATAGGRGSFNGGGASGSEAGSSAPATPHGSENGTVRKPASGQNSGVPPPPGSWDSVSTANPHSRTQYHELTFSMRESMRRRGIQPNERSALQTQQLGPPLAVQQQPAPAQPFPGHQVNQPPQQRPAQQQQIQMGQPTSAGLQPQQQQYRPPGQQVAAGSFLPSPFAPGQQPVNYYNGGGNPAQVYTQQPPAPSPYPPQPVNPYAQPYGQQPGVRPGMAPQYQTQQYQQPMAPHQQVQQPPPQPRPSPGSPQSPATPQQAQGPPRTAEEIERDRRRNMSEEEQLQFILELSKKER